MSRKLRYTLLALFIALIFSPLSAPPCYSQSGLPSIRFLGAAQMVGGSCTLIDTGRHRILIDFGLFYGAEYKDRNDRIDFDPATIDVVLLTHAHIDHAGRIPLLYRKGFNGNTIGTDATKALVEVNLKMGLAVAEKQGADLYDDGDYRRMMENFLAVPYDQLVELNSEVSVRLRNSGHIMGSSLIELWIRGPEGTVKVVATGDLGNDASSLLKKPDMIREGDYVIVESTAGPIKRKHKGFVGFGKEIQKTLKEGGSVLIPAFVLDRTQKVLYAIGMLKQKGIIPRDTPVYVDSGTARNITGIYRHYRQFFSSEAVKSFHDDGEPLSFQGLQEISSRDALMMHDRGEPAIYISSSAMLDHANAPRHLEKMIENPRNLLAIVAWQAPGTPGWKLQQKAKTLQIPVEEHTNGRTHVRLVEKPVRMRVKTFDMFSNHADGCQIMTWLSGFSKVKEVFVVHGDKENAVGLAEMIAQRLGFKTSVPAYGSMFPLSRGGQDYAIRRMPALCSGMETMKTLNPFSDQ
jgi:metallo-beta-lactamase family protein